MRLDVRDQRDDPDGGTRGVPSDMPARTSVLDVVSVCVPARSCQGPEARPTCAQQLPTHMYCVVPKTRIGNGARHRARLITITRSNARTHRHHGRMARFAAPPEREQQISRQEVSSGVRWPAPEPLRNPGGGVERDVPCSLRGHRRRRDCEATKRPTESQAAYHSHRGPVHAISDLAIAGSVTARRPLLSLRLPHDMARHIPGR